MKANYDFSGAERGKFYRQGAILRGPITVLDALDEAQTAPTSDARGSTILAVLENSPYPEIDLAPPRDRVPVQVREESDKPVPPA